MEIKATSPDLCTVIIPAFNREKLIVSAIENVLNQDCPNCGLIVVDDGSTDETAIRARAYPNVQVLSQANLGPAAARNLGIFNSNSEYVAFLDSDDLWTPGILIKLLNDLKNNPEIDVSMGLPQLARIKDNDEGDEFFGDPHSTFSHSLSGTLFRRSVFSRVGLLDPELRFGEDADWFCRARELKINISKLDVFSVIFRRHGDNMTKGKNMVDLNLLRVFKKTLDRKRSLTRFD